jgi:peptidyl-prolyl cis-trans isomerase SurA
MQTLFRLVARRKSRLQSRRLRRMLQQTLGCGSLRDYFQLSSGIATNMARRFFYGALALTLACVGLFGPSPTRAQDAVRIAAVVNDEPISVLDLLARSKLMLLTLSQPANADNIRQITAPVLRQLIEEKLQLQEARARGLKVPDEEIQAEMDGLERANGLPRGGLKRMFEANQIPLETLASQIRARLLWQRAVLRKMGPPTLLMSDEEIDDVLRQIQANKGKPEYLVAEIVLNVDEQPESLASARSTVVQIAEQLRNGGSFQALARQVSQSASAAVGGDLGWVSTGQLDPILEARVQRMNPGELSEPIQTPGALHILLLRDRRIAGAPRPAAPPQARPAPPQPGQPIPAAAPVPAPAPRPAVSTTALTDGNRAQNVRTLQYLFPLAPNMAPPAAQEIMGKIAAATREAKNCTEFTGLGAKLGIGQPIDLGRVRVSELNPSIQFAAASLPIGKPSDPVRLPVGVIVLMVCQREGGEPVSTSVAAAPPAPAPAPAPRPAPPPVAAAQVAPAPEAPEPQQQPPQEGPDGLPTREAIANRMVEERFDVFARRYMRELRQSAFIDMRM